MSISRNELQKAVFIALSASPVLAGILAPVFEHVPQNQTFPYVAIGKDESKDAGTQTFDAREFELVIDSWSSGFGVKQLKTLMDEADRILHRATLPMSGQTMVFCLFDTDRIDVEPDGVTYHGTQRFRTFIQGG